MFSTAADGTKIDSYIRIESPSKVLFSSFFKIILFSSLNGDSPTYLSHFPPRLALCPILPVKFRPTVSPAAIISIHALNLQPATGEGERPIVLFFYVTINIKIKACSNSTITR
jgi:hypothetical protein